MSASAKSRAAAARKAGSQPSKSVKASKSKKKLSASKAAEHILLEAVRKAIAKASPKAAKKAASAKIHAPTLKIQYVGGHHAASKSKKAASVKAAVVAASAKKARKPMSASKKAAAVERMAKARAAKAALVSNPRGRPKMSESAKARAAAARAAGKVSHSKSKRSASAKLFGGYKISLLKNPVTDFEIGGVKVVPALAGAAGAVALSQLIRNLPFVANMQAGIVKDLLPAAATVAVGAAGLYYAEKNKSSAMLKDLSKDIAAYGMFLGLNDVVGAKIRDMVDNLKSKPASPAAVAGGAFFNGGGWASAPMPQLEGYHMSGGESGYPPAFALTGGEGYFVPSGLALNGYHMSGDANSAATAAAITALNGGAFREQAIGGIDLNGYQD
jgi:hypothetical protein